MGWPKVTVAVGAASVWSEPSGCTYSNTAAIAERSKLFGPTLIPGAFFAFLRTRVYNLTVGGVLPAQPWSPLHSAARSLV